MDISINIVQQRPGSSAITPEQTKVPIYPILESGPNTTVEARSVTDIVSAAEKKQAQDQDGLGVAVNKLNDFLQSQQRDLRFNIDDKSGEMVVKVIDVKNQQVIRQIPSEEALKLARSLADQNEKGNLSIFSLTA